MDLPQENKEVPEGTIRQKLIIQPKCHHALLGCLVPENKHQHSAKLFASVIPQSVWEFESVGFTPLSVSHALVCLSDRVCWPKPAKACVPLDTDV